MEMHNLIDTQHHRNDFIIKQYSHFESLIKRSYALIRLIRKFFLRKNKPIERNTEFVSSEYHCIYAPTNNEWIKNRNNRIDTFI